MTTEKGQGNPDEKDNEKENQMDFEFIDENEIESVKRGRKAHIDNEMISFFQKMKIGQTVKIAKLAIAPNLFVELAKAIQSDNKEMIAEITAEIKKVKAKHSAMIRVQAQRSNWKKANIIWDKFGVPYAKRQA